ncbi:hypothetical protein [Streptomyces sp.]|uniref:hypothetical protein n=1 Tax=Streptomyces sp. TaxID=1931 RepID=UPI002F9230AB
MARKRGNAEALRKYWSKGGQGGAKIRWGTKGDWGRCNSNLKKYLGPRAAGFCQRLHMRNVGYYTGDRRNR